MTSSVNNQDKKKALLEFLDRGMTMVKLDSGIEGVDLPSTLMNLKEVRLNLSYRFDPPDLKIDDWGVRSTLSFSGSSYRVAIPWQAIKGFFSYDPRASRVFSDDPPDTKKPRTPGVFSDDPPDTKKPRTPGVRGHLRLVK